MTKEQCETETGGSLQQKTTFLRDMSLRQQTTYVQTPDTHTCNIAVQERTATSAGKRKRKAVHEDERGTMSKRRRTTQDKATPSTSSGITSNEEITRAMIEDYSQDDSDEDSFVQDDVIETTTRRLVKDSSVAENGKGKGKGKKSQITETPEHP